MVEMQLMSDVRKAASFDMTNKLDLHDPRFGNAGNTEVLCPTCKMHGDVCMGHHAVLSLGLHMFHPLVYKECQYLINNTCLRCKNNLSLIKTRTRAKKCPNCGLVNHGDYIVHANDMSAAVRDKSVLTAESVSHLLPDGYTLCEVLIPPIHLRTPEDMEWSTDLQKLYEQLVQKVRTKGDVCSAYTRILGAQKNEGVLGIMSGKNGVFRQFMMGKRVELSARAVVTGDPFLRMDQVYVPKVIAQGVKVKVICSKYNIQKIIEQTKGQSLWWPGTDDVVLGRNVLPGMTFERNLADGDFVLLNRQPSLSRQSLTCFKAVIRKDDYNVFSINPQATVPFNADFDGDEMNTFFLSQSCPMTCRAEMQELCTMQNTTPVQDVVTGCHIMSKHDIPVTHDVWSDCAVLLNTVPPTKTTHGILKACIPGYKGQILHKKNIKVDDLSVLQLVVGRWLSVRGLTVPLVPSVKLDVNDGEHHDAYRTRCINAVRQKMENTDLLHMINSGAKGTPTHVAHMVVALGQQYVRGREGTFCTKSYAKGLTPDEFFGHQMAAREGVVSTNVQTPETGYLNRRACKIMADLKYQYNGTVADNVMVSSFHL